MTRAEYEAYEKQVEEFLSCEGINCLAPVSDRAEFGNFIWPTLAP